MRDASWPYSVYEPYKRANATFLGGWKKLAALLIIPQVVQDDDSQALAVGVPGAC